ncbi:MAG TPA: hypothetical protein VFT55_07090 [Planctomycetota bacterium]|nr:hypothetical protein [Planctomycetota bacterium]
MSLPARVAPFLLAASLVAQSPWSAPVLESALNSTAADTGPHLSFDGLTLYFASFRVGTTSNWEIFASTRAFQGGPWSAPVQITELGGTATDDQPFVAVGNLEVYFSSTRTGGAGGFDILRSTRLSTAVAWDPPTFVTELNSTGSESAFSMTLDGLEAYMLTTGWGSPSGANNQIFRATRASTAVPWGTPALVTELSNPNTHRDCEIAPDGLSIVYTEFISPRLKVLYASRPDRVSPFSPPVVWTEFDTTGTSQGVFGFTRSLAGDEAFLAAGFAAAAGGQEIMSTRRSLFYGAGCGSPLPLGLTCTTPVLGTDWDFTTTNIDPVSPIAVTFFGFAEAAVPLDFLGAPGCSAYVGSIVSTLAEANLGGTSLLTIPVPADPGLMGFSLKGQSICLTFGNPLGLYTSNGVTGTVGL